MGQGDAELADVETELQSVQDAAQLWRAIVAQLEAGGFAAAGPEYLKLSEILRRAHARELLDGTPDDPAWIELQAIGRQAVEQLGPLVAAAQRLAELPVGDVAEPDSAADEPAPPRRRATRPVAAVKRPPARRRSGSR
ncbi:MAG: hypothetical protein AAGA99_21305 [Actinomycetota bacterium]